MKIKLFLKYFIFLVTTGFLVFLYSFSKKRDAAEIVSKIEVEFEAGTNNFLTHSMVNKLLIQNRKTIKNQAKSVINLYGLENAVLKNPYVEKSTVFLTIDGVLKTFVKQRNAIARVVVKNDSYYLDKKGVKFPLSANYTARVPLITTDKDAIDVANIMLLMQPILEDDFLQKEIVEIHQYDVHNFQLFVRSGDYTIEFGKLERVDQKFKKLKALYSFMFLENKLNQYKTIHLQYRNQVVCAK